MALFSDMMDEASHKDREIARLRGVLWGLVEILEYPDPWDRGLTAKWNKVAADARAALAHEQGG